MTPTFPIPRASLLITFNRTTILAAPSAAAPLAAAPSLASDSRSFHSTPQPHALLPWSSRPRRVPKLPSAKLLKLNPRLARAEERKRGSRNEGKTILPFLATRANKSPREVRWGDFRGTLTSVGGSVGDASDPQPASFPLDNTISALRSELLRPSSPSSVSGSLSSNSPISSVPSTAPYFTSHITPREARFALFEAPATLAETNDEERLEMVRRAISLENAGLKEVNSWNRRRVVGVFGRKASDTGSSEVQAAVFTARILAIKTHLLGCNGKDKHAKRRLAILESKRDRALHYLRRKDLPAFVEVGKALGVDLGRFSGL